MISQSRESEILRLYHVEHWTIGTIASQLHIHHRTVSRVLEQDGRPRRKCPRSSKLDPFMPWIKETLEKYPSLTASRIHEMLATRGFDGKSSIVRLAIAKLRPRRQREAFLRLRTLSGEQAQVDWGHFGRISCGRIERPLMAFVMILSYSRAIYLRFYLSQNIANWMSGHDLAFRWFGGIPRCCLYDNLKSVVVERSGQAIRFNTGFLDLANHYHFEPRPVAVARGNEKGRVERSIRYIRDSFFAARQFRDLAHLNQQAEEWCNTIALDRPWPEDKTRRIRQVLSDERSALLPIPVNPYPCEERAEVSVGKSPWVRFDLNDYSVPHTSTRKTLVVMAAVDTIRILDGHTVVARHARSYDRGQQIEDSSHTEQLLAAKSQATQHRNVNYLTSSAPATIPLLEAMAKRGLPLLSASKQLLSMLQIYGAPALDNACNEALLRNSPHPQSVRHILECLRQEEGKPPALSIPLPDDPRVQNLVVKPADLTAYDRLITIPHNKEQDDE